MNPSPRTAADHSGLLTFVHELKSDVRHRGTLALLRGALTDSGERQMRAWRVLARFGGIPTDDPHRAEVVRTVAGLLAQTRLHHSSGAGSFGLALRNLLGDEERKTLQKPGQTGPVSRRVQHLLAATRREICDRVRQLGRRLDGSGAVLNFELLHLDLLRWSDRVKGQWAADFWGAAEEVDAATPPENPR